ncbi:putative endonuclease related to cardiolipin synthase [Candidatus Carsonella ruddii HT isolate Thao2000]|uniref:Putative endonuclease related to cardiolipin synthase n=1 Tax=Candidatus Carsonella ruddii HT isolate Thao2000 TaxID=1202539 RepID=J3TWA6_CARRU|nr:phospholipase D-like domain-containing protein [Candidatus Carsonella ruddii]AFP84120.1 putative endonuclease related to cardiolipin synthase [Candidatus Carsonella ruddii HT isolate Thao2000]
MLLKIKILFLFLNDIFFNSSFFVICFLLNKTNKNKLICYSKKKKNNKFKYNFFFNGFCFFKNLFNSIIISKKNIYIEFYIIKNDFLGKKMLNLLIYKSIKNLILLSVDYIGTNIYKKNIKKIFLLIYNKNHFFINNRNHKKIVFIDNKKLWIGGNNVGNEYISMNPNIKYWNDFHCLIQNVYPNFIPENFNFKKINNNFTIKKIEICKKYFFLKNNIINFINMIIYFCKKNIFFMSPYIILDLNLIKIIKILLKKNIKIKFIVSYKTDNYFIHFSSLIFLKFLTNYKIEIFFLEIGFYHRKIYLIDETYVCFGSMNFDIRSIYINNECLFIIKDYFFFYKILNKIKKNFFPIFINYKKNSFFLKIIYIVSFLNYFIQ